MGVTLWFSGSLQAYLLHQRSRAGWIRPVVGPAAWIVDRSSGMFYRAGKKWDKLREAVGRKSALRK